MSNTGGVAADELRSFVERLERLIEEKKGILEQIKEVKAEAKGRGYDVPTINAIIKLRAMEQSERDEQEALLDLYKAALGMLNGTPLGDAAVRRLSQKPSDPRREEDGQTDIEDLTKPPAKTDDVSSEPESAGPTIEEARQMGRDAAKAGKPVTDNPFPARDQRRAAWDEEWCRASGSDGMDLPSAWRRSTPKKAAKSDDKKAA